MSRSVIGDPVCGSHRSASLVGMESTTHRCTACRTDDHATEAHHDARLAWQESKRHEAAGDDVLARAWRVTALTLTARRVA